MEICELEDRCACATDPLNVVLSKVVKPLETVAADDQREEVGDSVIVVGIGQYELAFEHGIGEGSV